MKLAKLNYLTNKLSSDTTKSQKNNTTLFQRLLSSHSDTVRTLSLKMLKSFLSKTHSSFKTAKRISLCIGI